MANKWEKLAGETGEEVPTSRWARMFKLGGLGMKVAASAVVNKAARAVLPGSKESKEESRKRSLEKNAKEIAKVLGQLKGASMKLGQILSADPEVIPEEFLPHLATLQKNAPPMPYNTVKAQIEKALDRPIESVFHTFSPEPVGSASIGQVHRGTLLTGEDVAVKVQYPGIVASLHSDLKNLATLFGFKRAVVDKKRLDEWLEECKRAILEEADYELEAYHLRRFADHVKGRPGLRVPLPFEEWTKGPVLVMQYIEGRKFDEALATIADAAHRQRLLERFVQTYVWMFHELYELHSDPHPGNFLLDADDNLVVLDFGCVKRCPKPLADGVLEILIACWDDDDERAAQLYQEMGFGKDDADARIFEPVLLREYHELVLAPFLYDGDFDFADWKPTPQIMRFVMKNPRFLKITPPADLLLYLRVLSGVKGLVTKLEAKMNLRKMARDMLVTMGRLPAQAA